MTVYQQEEQRADEGAGRAAVPILETLGRRTRQHRTSMGFSRARLADRAGVSPRYIAQLETGKGNISVALLDRVAAALGVEIATLFSPNRPEHMMDIESRFERAPRGIQEQVKTLLGVGAARAKQKDRIALIGLRGAGKSTLGARAAQKLGARFVELNREIEADAGVAITDVFSLYGAEGYRRLEQAALSKLVDAPGAIILAVGGGLVQERQTFELLKSNFATIWLKATPTEHMARVRAQGDERPMQGSSDAMAQLRAILSLREPLYAEADHVLDTSSKSFESTLGLLTQLLDDVGFQASSQRA